MQQSTVTQTKLGRLFAVRADRKAARVAHRKLVAELASFDTPAQRLEIMTIAERHQDEVILDILARQASRAA
ncbi:hypothetical protein [Nakamurella leprariae]|uniref:Uncharacterized protein n=1 Tax=Nakamurella leprariae TaxID=2803911 RepID=A0A939BVF4_9ACTN|nr:hypothetical protein [Nakamurella leprariae]MBM9466463.1 hypothetical protein [Nakamurella leprariae]